MEPAEILERCAHEFDINKEVMLGYRTVRQTFDRFPKNVEESDVLLKVVVLNGLYNTYLLDKVKMANHIHKLATEKNLDILLESGKIEAVDKIRLGHGIGSGKKRDLYSFATKYCHFANQKCFPMYDKHVETAIKKLRKDKYIQFRETDDVRNSQKFREIIDQIIQKCSLKDYTTADRALWTYGRHLGTVK